jgi:hypothetical protein
MTQMPTSLDSTLLTIVLATLAIGMPILTILAIRFFWDRSLYLGRSKELEKMIWQLHRIASAMEHQLNVSFPPVQPGTEDATDIAFLEKPAAPAKRAPAPTAAAPTTQQPRPAVPQPAAPLAQTPAPAAVNRVPAAATPSATVPPPQPPEAPALQPEAAPPQPVAVQPQPDAEQSAEPEGFKPLVPRDPKDPPRQGGVNSMFGF